MSQITIIGGGLAGLTAAVACAEAGAEVVVHEAHATLGGRARTSEPPWLAHEGPHAFYADGPHWHWLVERDLVGPLATAPAARGPRRAVPPRRAPAPDPAGEPARRCSPTGAAGPRWTSTSTPGPPRCTARRPRGPRRACWASSPSTPIPAGSRPPSSGTCCSAFTAARAPAVRWPVGGWPSVVDRLAARARELGVRIETSSRVDALPEPPVIVATQLESARALLGDDGLAWESGRCVLLDVGLAAPARRRVPRRRPRRRGLRRARDRRRRHRSRRPATRSCRPTCR